MKTDLISIIIPVYNVQDYLARCLNSVINQSYNNLEIILIDDGSTDNSRKICLDYSKKDKRIKYYKIKNGGAGAARNKGLEVATGKYLGFVDSDDVIDKDMFLILYKNLITTKADLSICEVKKFSDTITFFKTTDKEVYDKTTALKILLEDKKICSYSVNKLCKKELLKGVKYPLGKVQEDVGTIYKFIKNADKIVYTESQLYGYYSRNNSVTKTLTSKFIYDYFENIEKRALDLQGYNVDDYLILNKVNVTLGIFIDLSLNQKLLQDKKLNKYLNMRLLELKKIFKKVKKINTTKHNILITILLLNRKVFFLVMSLYLKIKR